MSQENVEIPRRWYEAANRRDVDAGNELLDPDFEFRMAGVLPDFPQTAYRGRDEFVAFLWEFAEPWEALTIEPDRYLDIGSQVLVLAHFHAKGRDGIEIERPFAHLWTIRDGRAVRLVSYADHRQALEAVGLSEQDAHAGP
jgi:ketosteroid isomerase-like protein